MHPDRRQRRSQLVGDGRHEGGALARERFGARGRAHHGEQGERDDAEEADEHAHLKREIALEARGARRQDPGRKTQLEGEDATQRSTHGAGRVIAGRDHPGPTAGVDVARDQARQPTLDDVVAIQDHHLEHRDVLVRHETGENEVRAGKRPLHGGVFDVGLLLLHARQRVG